jgi:Putative Ig domain
VVDSPPPPLLPFSLSITTQQLPDGRAGLDYAYTLHAEGGSRPYQWSHASNLPAGMFMDPESGLVSGTPTARGTTSFTVKVKDNVGTVVEAPFTIRVN